ncbi:MAG: CoA-binding protein [Candidatus Micrarchaeaceae archaeon]
MNGINYMLRPKSVAIIGASREPGKVGHVILENYVNSGYEGRLFPINPNADSILGLKAYKSVKDVPYKVDLSVIAVPAESVPKVLQECGEKGVKACVIVSGGFAEVGRKDLQDQIVEISKKYNISTLGPNCLGVMDPRSRVDTLFLPTYKLSRPSIGGVSFIAQSGAVGSTILDLIAGEGFGLSKFFSYGNAAVIDETDLLEFLAKDPDTKVIVMYLEGIKRGKEFLKVGYRTSLKKPVVVLKAGRTAQGIKAAHSHTAALAGDYAVQYHAFRQVGFCVVEDLKDLLYLAKVFESEPEPKGNRVAIVTNGGGAGVITADAVGLSKSLSLAEFSDSTKEKLRKVLPNIVSINNPLDLAGDADEKRYDQALRIIVEDKNVDMIAVIALFQTPGADSKLAAKLVSIKQQTEKPMIVISVGAEYSDMHRIIMESSGLPVYDSPAKAIESLDALYSYYSFVKKRKSQRAQAK